MKLGAPLVVRGPPPEILRFFSAKFYKKKTFFHIFKMKWPKSEEKIKIGRAPEKLGGPPEVVPPPIAKVWLRHWPPLGKRVPRQAFAAICPSTRVLSALHLPPYCSSLPCYLRPCMGPTTNSSACGPIGWVGDQP